MNQDQLINLIQTLFKVGGGALVAKGFGDSSLWEGISGAIVAVLTWYLSHKWNATPGTSQSISIPITKITPLLALAAGIFWISGCAHIQPGNDPLVVNVERTETVAKSTFDLVLNVDNSNRAFFVTNAPPFHSFCEWLRQPQTVEGTNTLPRAAAILVSLDDVKLEYQSARASSNDVYTALSTVQSVMGQANAWLTVVTNQPSTH